MSNTNTNLQTQASNALYNAIMEAGGKDCPPMLAPGIDNDIYSTVDAVKMHVKCGKLLKGHRWSKESGIQCYNFKEYRHVARECQKPKRAKDAAYHKEKMLLCDTNITIDSLDMSTNKETVVQDDDGLARERDLLASLIDKLKCEIDDSKNRNKFLESSNKTLVDKLKDLMKFQAELDRYHDVNYASKVEIDCVKAKGDLMKYYYANHMNAILGVYTTLDESTDLQCEYVDKVVKCERLEKELSKKQIKNDKAFKENHSNAFLKEHEQYFEIQDLKAQLQDKNIALCELKKIYEKLKGKSVETKFDKPSVIRQPNAFKSQRQSVLGVIPTTSASRPQLKSNQLEDRVMPNNSQGKKQEVEDHRRNFKFSNNKTSATTSRRDNSIHRRLWVLKAHDGKISATKSNFVEKFLGTVKFGNDQIAPILGYGDLVQGTITIKRVYYVEGLNHNLFSVGQFCDADLEVSFRKSTCYIRDLKGNDLLIGSRGTYLYSITLQDTSTPNPICLMAKATSSQAWLWHCRLSYLNFNSINLLSNNDIVIDLPKYTWTHFLRSKDETPEVLIDFLRLVQRGLHAQVRTVQTNKGMEFLNKTLHAYFSQEGVEHQTSTSRTPKQNGVVERRNRALVEAARTMLSAAKVPLFFCAEAIATTCFTQNRSLVIPRHEKTPYHIINGQIRFVKFLSL
ncbi:putative ribonuclease H-like domain-containing protein [Tanacetum coccineum]